jgi:UDP-N-acetylmuramyl pentapeptide synthase
MRLLIKKILIALLTLEARLVLKKYKPRVIAVTGSVGKTSTKDAIYTALSGSSMDPGSVRKSEKSFNSEIGVPLTVLGLPNAWGSLSGWIKNLWRGGQLVFSRAAYPAILVLEVGADHPGDIRKAASWLRPDVAVLTRFPEVPVHVEFFASPEAVIEEKRELVRYLKPDGVLILNADDAKMREEHGGSRRIAYGIHSTADIKASHIEYACDSGGSITGMHFHIESDGKSVPMRVEGALGVQHVYPLLAAMAVTQAENRGLIEVTKALTLHHMPPGRMRILKGRENTTIIDDTYNSSPIAAAEALKVLNEAPCGGRRIAVMGDMRELGTYADVAHEEIGSAAARAVDLLIGVGEKAAILITAARNAGLHTDRAIHFDDSTGAGEYLSGALAENDLILVKGSQSIRMERVVEALMAEPEKKRELLVRQEEEWKVR